MMDKTKLKIKDAAELIISKYHDMSFEDTRRLINMPEHNIAAMLISCFQNLMGSHEALYHVQKQAQIYVKAADTGKNLNQGAFKNILKEIEKE
jgi:predicted RNA binding protein YcfA (HicA-like mRNA interferase family)